MDAIYARQSIDQKGQPFDRGQIELCRKFTVGDALDFFGQWGLFRLKTPSGLLSASSWRRMEAGRVEKNRRLPAGPLQPLPRGFQPDLGASA